MNLRTHLPHHTPAYMRMTCIFSALTILLVGCSSTTNNASSLRQAANEAQLTTASSAPALSSSLETATRSSSESTAGLLPLGDATLDAKNVKPSSSSSLVVTGVRIGHHDGFDRVVFDLEGEGEPGWFIDYTDSPTQQASGRPLVIEGTSMLNVSLSGTRYPFELGLPDPQLDTASEDNTGIVTQVVSGGVFEGITQCVIGLRGGKHPYSASLMTEPTRLVLDIMS